MFLTLDGDDYANGLIMGTEVRKTLRSRILTMQAQQKKGGYSQSTIDARVRDFTRILKRVSPHWLAEAKGLADGAKVRLDDILQMNCLPPDFPGTVPPSNNCTTFLRIGQTENELLKIRDEMNHVQAFYIKRSHGMRCQVGHDIGNIGIAHGFNDHAVALANNTGSKTLMVGDGVALNDCQILRFLAERATSVDDAPRLLEMLLNMKVVGGAGMNRGSIFTLCDRTRGLVMDCVSDQYSCRWVAKGTQVISNHFLTGPGRSWESAPPDVNTLTRKKRMECLLRPPGHRVDRLDIFAITRDRKSTPHSLCNDDNEHFWMTISAHLAVIRRDQPGLSVNHVCCGNTANSPFIPIPLASSASYRPLLNGSWYEATDRLYRRQGCGRHLARRLRAFESACDGSERDLLRGYALLAASARASDRRAMAIGKAPGEGA